MLGALLTELLAEAFEHTEFFQEVALPAVERLLRVFVGVAACGMDDRAAEPPFLYLCIITHHEYRRKSEAVYVRFQGAKIVGKNFREHRDRAIHQVDGCAAALAL